MVQLRLPTRSETIAWSSAPPYPICNRWTGEVIAHLPFAEAPSEFSLPTVSSDGQFLTIAAANAPRLFQIETGKAVRFAGAPSNARFAGPLLIGPDTKGSDGVWDPQTGRRIATWPGGHHIPTTAHVGLGVAVVNLPNQPVTVVALDNGDELATLDVHGSKGIDLGPSVWVAPGNCFPRAPTDPDVRISRIRFFEAQIRYEKSE